MMKTRAQKGHVRKQLTELQRDLRLIEKARPTNDDRRLNSPESSAFFQPNTAEIQKLIRKLESYYGILEDADEADLT